MVMGRINMIYEIVLAGVTVSACYYFYKKINKLKDALKEAYSKLKSKEVRFGNLMEKLAPFFKDFPVSTDDIHFLGKPIDFVSFTDNEVAFVECKTGVSNLSDKQKNIKKLIEEGKVKFYEVRY